MIDALVKTGSSGITSTLLEACIALPHAAWRSARERRSQIDLVEFAEDWELASRRLLADEYLCSMLDRLLARPPGYHRSLRIARRNADNRRKLRYVRDVLINAHLGHHTGRKGVVSPIRLGTASLTNPSESTRESTWWASVSELLSVEQLESDTTPLPRTASAPERYAIAVDASVDAKLISALPFWCVDELVQRIALTVADVAKCDHPTILTIAADLMLRFIGEWKVIEVHAPARSIGAAGIAHSLAYGLQPCEWFDELLDRCRCMPVPELPVELSDHTFSQLDLVFLSKATADRQGTPARLPADGAYSGHSLKIGGLTLPVSKVQRTSWATRLVGLSGVSPATTTVCSERNAELPSVLNDITDDGWFVAKQDANWPWWHPSSRSVRFVHINWHSDVAAIRDWSERERVSCQPLLQSSVDTRGLSGELRVFGIALLTPVRKP